MIIIKPSSHSINMHLLYTVRHTFLLTFITSFQSLVIISLILITCLFKQEVLLLGEIGLWLKRLINNIGCGKVSRQTEGVENERTR